MSNPTEHRKLPGFTNKTCVSRNEGSHPEWHPKGTELFFLANERRTMMSARLNQDRGQFEEPVTLFDLPESIYRDDPWRFGLFDVTPDGERFLMLQKVPDQSVTNQVAKPDVMLVENWFEEFRDKK